MQTRHSLFTATRGAFAESFRQPYAEIQSKRKDPERFPYSPHSPGTPTLPALRLLASHEICRGWPGVAPTVHFPTGTDKHLFKVAMLLQPALHVRAVPVQPTGLCSDGIHALGKTLVEALCLSGAKELLDVFHLLGAGEAGRAD